MSVIGQQSSLQILCITTQKHVAACIGNVDLVYAWLLHVPPLIMPIIHIEFLTISIWPIYTDNQCFIKFPHVFGEIAI